MKSLTVRLLTPLAKPIALGEIVAWNVPDRAPQLGMVIGVERPFDGWGGVFVTITGNGVHA